MEAHQTDTADRAVRSFVYDFVADRERPPTAETGAGLGTGRGRARDADRRLDRRHGPVLEPDGGTIRMAPPFSGCRRRSASAPPAAPILLFRSEGGVDGWCARHGARRGNVLSLDRAWAVAKARFGDRLDPGYRGRSLAEAEAIFRRLGLDPPSWSPAGA